MRLEDFDQFFEQACGMSDGQQTCQGTYFPLAN